MTKPKDPKDYLKRGAPTKFTKKREQLILDLAKSGEIDEEIAKKAKIKAKTIQNWINKNPDFFLALKEAKSFTNDLAEASLLRLALGYTKEEVKVFCDKNGIIHEHRYQVEVEPNITAIIFWLKNRRPDTWREKGEALKLGENLLELIMQTQLSKDKKDESSEPIEPNPDNEKVVS